MVLQAGLKVKRYIYVDVDEAARQVAKRHSRRLKTQFPEQLATSAIKTSFSTLAGDIALVSAEDIHRCSHMDQGCHVDVFRRTDGRSDDGRGGVRDLDAL
jgi:hypothetical protein